MPGTVQGSCDILVNKTDKDLCFLVFIFWWREGQVDSKQ